ncbi:alpha/beta-hydrolase [Hesseltinella vesiculosa]|uniref:Alpha/beta-hydrolase n=1 Tax=Hesseltinella vesiculosa TaxID=101127 RepID=A0A1X2GGD8_9FUNG|nr:alpha/beta-hydrolase [Hesseltinella vesiculosa]
MSYQGPSSQEHENTTTETKAIIIAHPYGPLGGNMQNNVVMALHRWFTAQNYVTVSFNFRGSGRSSGRTSWTGIPEQHDYQAVVDSVLANSTRYPKIDKLFICGYSYGSMVASSIRVSIPSAYILISYPLSVRWALAATKASYFKSQVQELLTSTPARVLIVHGDQDQFTSDSSYHSWLASVDDIQHQVVQGVDHFWYNQEEQLVKIVGEFCASQ